MTQVHYEAAVLQEFASRLYSRARNLTILYGLIGMLVSAPAALAGSLAIGASPRGIDDMSFIIGGLGALLGLVMGVSVGREKGFQLRLQAQTALCQVRIEAHLAVLVRQIVK